MQCHEQREIAKKGHHATGHIFGFWERKMPTCGVLLSRQQVVQVRRPLREQQGQRAQL